MKTINISGLDKAAVLRTLYDNAKPLGLGFLHHTPEPMSVEESERLIHEHLNGSLRYFDYLHGRVMKISVKDNLMDVRLYDRDNGEGSAEAALRAAGLL